jgi:hypothetical protein
MPVREDPAILKPPDENEPMDSGPIDVTLETAVFPDQREDPADFIVDDKPFAFSPGQLNKMLNPKSLAAYQALGGLAGLEKGLRTDLQSGLGMDEPGLNFEDHKVRSEGGAPIAGTAAAAATAYWKRPLGSLTSSGLWRSKAGTTTPGAATDGAAHSDRKRVSGQNRLPEKRPRSFSDLAWMAFYDKILRLLTIAATISLALVGDILHLEPGDIVPVDGIFIQGQSEHGWNDDPQKGPNRAEYTGPTMHGRSRFVLPLRIDKTEVDAIPDTGADENAMSSACARHLGIKIERDLSCKSNSSAFRLANGRAFTSCGIASVPSLSFVKGNNSWKLSKDPVFFRVFDALAVPMILGRRFLKETETLSRYTDRLETVAVATSPASSSVPRILHMNSAKERMLCYVNGVPVYANADTGAEMNLASPEWAARHAGAAIQQPGRGYEEVMLADGSRAGILGQFDARFQLYDDESSTAGKQSRAITSTRRFFILDGLVSDILLGPDLLFDIGAFKEHQESFVVLGAPTSGSFSDVNFVAWLSKPEKVLLGLFRGGRESNTNTTGVQSEADFRGRLDDEDAREQQIHKHAEGIIDQLPEPERSRRLDAENKRHRQYLGDRERREREYSTTASVQRRMISSAC